MKLKSNLLIVNAYNKANGFRKKIKGSNNKLNTHNAIMKNSVIEVVGDDNLISIGKNTRLYNSKIFVSGSDQELNIGDNCIIKNTILWFEDHECKILIGNHTTIEGAHIAITEPNSLIKIGEDCMFSSGVDIRNGDSHSILDMKTQERINFAKDIIISDHVWLGAHVQVLKGVNIGQQSIIGVRSLVTKDVPNNSIATGSPSVVRKSDITWSRKRMYDSEEVISHLEQTAR